MCGLCGTFAPGGVADRGVAAAMHSRLVHRGPDETYSLSTPVVSMKLGRLGMTGLRDGWQPSEDHSGRFVAMTNGEVFNEADLRRRLGIVTGNDLGRTQGNVAVNVDVPVSRRNRDFSALGNLTLNANAGVEQLSDFGTLTTVGAGFNWSPVERLNVIASWTREEGAPSIQQLGDPILETPDSRVFDFTRGETVFATVVTGGLRFGMMIARANWRAVKGTTLARWAPSRTCKCQSSGRSRVSWVMRRV